MVDLIFVAILSVVAAACVVLLGHLRAHRLAAEVVRAGWVRPGPLGAVLARVRPDAVPDEDRTGEAGIIPVVAVLVIAGIGVVIDQLVLDGDVSAVLFDMFFKAVQALGDAVFAAIGGMVGMLPDAADLDLTLPTGIVRGYAVLNSFLPLAEALQVVAVIIAAYGVLFTWRLAVTIYKLIPKPLMGT